MAHTFAEDADYWRAKCALLEAAEAERRAEAIRKAAWQKVYDLGLSPAPSYSWDDQARVITPHTGG